MIPNGELSEQSIKESSLKIPERHDIGIGKRCDMFLGALRNMLLGFIKFFS
jgi:hypothetical protein